MREDALCMVLCSVCWCAHSSCSPLAYCLTATWHALTQESDVRAAVHYARQLSSWHDFSHGAGLVALNNALIWMQRCCSQARRLVSALLLPVPQPLQYSQENQQCCSLLPLRHTHLVGAPFVPFPLLPASPRMYWLDQLETVHQRAGLVLTYL